MKKYFKKLRHKIGYWLLKDNAPINVNIDHKNYVKLQASTILHRFDMAHANIPLDQMLQDAWFETLHKLLQEVMTHVVFTSEVEPWDGPRFDAEIAVVVEPYQEATPIPTPLLGVVDQVIKETLWDARHNIVSMVSR